MKILQFKIEMQISRPFFSAYFISSESRFRGNQKISGTKNNQILRKRWLKPMLSYLFSGIFPEMAKFH
jgi:hypothetical protein